MGQTWGTRPSALVGIQDDFVAYCFDEAVTIFCVHVESELGRVNGKTPAMTSSMRERVLSKLLGEPERFADPVAMGKVKRA